MARATSTAANVMGTRVPCGGSMIAAIGRTAPRVNDTPDANAACHGLTTSSCWMWSSVARCAASTSCAVSSSATRRAVPADKPCASYKPVSSASSASGSVSSSSRSFAMSAFSLSLWLLTETYSPSAMDTAPPTSPATPAVRIWFDDVVAPATPTTIAATEMIPSFAPSTPARSQFSRCASPPRCGSPSCWLGGSVGTLCSLVTIPTNHVGPREASRYRVGVEAVSGVLPGVHDRVLAHAAHDGVPQSPGPGAGHVRDVDEHRRLAPVDPGGVRRRQRVVERARRASQRREATDQEASRRAGEATACASEVTQSPVGVAGAEHEGAERPAGARRGQPAADQCRARRAVGCLDPVGGAAPLLVGRGPTLGQDPLEAVLE